MLANTKGNPELFYFQLLCKCDCQDNQVGINSSYKDLLHTRDSETHAFQGRRYGYLPPRGYKVPTQAQLTRKETGDVLHIAYAPKH